MQFLDIQFKENKPIYHVDKIIRETGKVFDDGAHIIYVNGKYRGEDDFGKTMLDEYPARLKDFRNVVHKGERIEPQKWQNDMEALFDKREDMKDMLQKEVGDLACVEVIDYNRKNEQRERSNEAHQKERQQERELHPSRKHGSMER